MHRKCYKNSGPQKYLMLTHCVYSYKLQIEWPYVNCSVDFVPWLSLHGYNLRCAIAVCFVHVVCECVVIYSGSQVPQA